VRFRLATYSIFLSIGFGLGLFTILAHAERADKDKPIALSSDKALFDDVKQIYYLERNVLLIKGSLIIKGEKAEVKIDPEGYQFVTIFAKPGEQASLRQKRDTGFNDFIEGFAELIEYDGKTDIAILQKQARMNQISGTRVTDQLNGDKIHYDGNTEKYNVVSKVSVKSTLSPRRKELTGPSK
jgi:lipopolysaccharide export system protein LptA